MKIRQVVGFVLVLISLVLLYPGITQPMLTITASIKFLAFEKEVMRETRSILGTVKYLWETKNQLVAGLIFLFSVLIPLLKAILLGVAFLTNNRMSRKIFEFVQVIGKWSMADVFVMAVFVAYLSTEGMAEIKSVIEVGFYWFLSYCMVSLVSLQVLKWDNKDV